MKKALQFQEIVKERVRYYQTGLEECVKAQSKFDSLSNWMCAYFDRMVKYETLSALWKSIDLSLEELFQEDCTEEDLKSYLLNTIQALTNSVLSQGLSSYTNPLNSRREELVLDATKELIGFRMYSSSIPALYKAAFGTPLKEG